MLPARASDRSGRTEEGSEERELTGRGKTKEDRYVGRQFQRTLKEGRYFGNDLINLKLIILPLPVNKLFLYRIRTKMMGNLSEFRKISKFSG